MSASVSIKAHASPESKDFQKHYKAVQFCIENQLSFPKETSEFFKGKVGGDDLEDLKPESILQYLENGMNVDMPIKKTKQGEYHIKVSEIPSEVDLIVVKLEY
jgi:hypothetical protein